MMHSLQFMKPLALALMAAASLAAAQAATTPKAQYAEDSKAALARYEADKKLCNDETSPAARVQCRRDAKTLYDQALAEAKARMAAAGGTTAKPASAAVACPDCAHVIAVSATEKAGEGSALGMIAGGAAGALLGRQVGGGSGSDIATIAGAVGGAYAGKKIEEKAKTHKAWIVTVEYEDGRKENFEFAEDPGFKVGDSVRKSGKTLVK